MSVIIFVQCINTWFSNAGYGVFHYGKRIIPLHSSEGFVFRQKPMHRHCKRDMGPNLFEGGHFANNTNLANNSCDHHKCQILVRFDNAYVFLR